MSCLKLINFQVTKLWSTPAIAHSPNEINLSLRDNRAGAMPSFKPACKVRNALLVRRLITFWSRTPSFPSSPSPDYFAGQEHVVGRVEVGNKSKIPIEAGIGFSQRADVAVILHDAPGFE